MRDACTLLLKELVGHHGGGLHAALKGVPQPQRKVLEPLLAKAGLGPPGAVSGPPPASAPPSQPLKTGMPPPRVFRSLLKQKKKKMT